jgi:hypothetical protein
LPRINVVLCGSFVGPLIVTMKRFQRSCSLSIQTMCKDVLVRVRFLDNRVEINEHVPTVWLGTSEPSPSSPKLSSRRSLDGRSNRLKTYLTS